ncbi:MAG: sterol desaturase family protein [Paracoccaceae bacterium]
MLDETYNTLLTAVGAFLDPRERLSIYWMLAALGIAIAYYSFVVHQNRAAGPAGLLKWLMPRQIIFHPSAMTDYVYFVVNRLLRAFVYLQVFTLVPWVNAYVLSGMIAIWGPMEWSVAPSLFWTLVVTLVIALVMDFSLWFGHWIFHVVPELWEFHKVHHSAEVMTPLTAARMHPVEEIVDSLIASAAIGAIYATFTYTLGPAMLMVTLLEMNIIVVGFYVAAFNLRHSHVFLRYPSWLQHVFVSPAQHQIHHSRAPEHWNRNMGFIFAFWDWAAGTLVSPKHHMNIEFGLGTQEDGTWRGVRMLYLRPFVGAWARLQERLGKSRIHPGE